ncbi:succinylglutamate desuccinylase/aspartoacylase family protein [Nakamurella alba]|uniref:succinylglutamate desuccinylase/aspartoacylase family protein n=1 Tax=Nakamurella alba TaxID=2665158 RepID=UPI0018AC2082|nr:succinylglutamate desuccinylase/aspartoacylase family protein [Nakamurella alba]
MTGTLVASFDTLGLACDPGTAVKARVPIGTLHEGTPVTLPVHVLHGAHPGPVACLTASVHGDERTGVFILAEVLGAIDPAELRGTIVAFPVVNPLAWMSDARVAPLDASGTNMNRAFPGRPDGSISDRLADAVQTGGIARADYCVDFHDGGCDCHARFTIVHDSTDADLVAGNRFLAAAYGNGMPVVLTPPVATTGMGGMITRAANTLGTPAICVELGGHGPVDPAVVAEGARGLRRVLVARGNLPGDPPEPEVLQELGDPYWLRAEDGGIWRPSVDVDAVVEAGDEIGTVADVFGDVLAVVRADVRCTVVSLRRSATLMTGDWICYIAPTPAGDR